MLALDIIVHLIGEDVLASLLLSDTLFQPVLCAILGLVPSCAMSVLLSELFAAGTISFGALIAGLSTGAGFGYIVLFQDREGRRRALPGHRSNAGGRHSRRHADPAPVRLTKRVSPFRGGRFLLPSRRFGAGSTAEERSYPSSCSNSSASLAHVMSMRVKSPPGV